MQDLVILPTYDRPELLWLCLEHIAASPDYHSVQIRVVVDAHIGQILSTPREDIEIVLDKFPQLSLQVGYRTPHQFYGNSYNVLMSFKDAYETEAEHVFLIEDDVMVHPLFFLWHRAQHEDRSIGASIGVIKESFHSNYASWGVCFRRETLRLILPHCRVAYFQNMRQYLRAHFPPSKVEYEQDGLWCRVLARHRVIYAPFPFAQHVGWYGYHRPKGVRPYGTLEQRYEQIKQALVSEESLRNVVRDNFQDVHPLQLPPCN